MEYRHRVGLLRGAVNGALIAAACLFAAGCLVAGGTKQAVSTSSQPAGSPEPALWPAPPPALAALPEAAEWIEPSQLQVKLLGTLAGSDPELSHATLYDLEREQSFVLGVGDAIGDHAVVVRIERERVVLLENGVPRELRLAAAQVASLSGRKGTPRLEDRSLGEVRAPVSHSDLARVIAKSMFNQAQVMLEMEEERLVGLEINAIAADSFFAEMGIENGDVITQFNGIAIESLAESLDALKEMTEAPEYFVVARRNDALEHFSGYFSSY